MSRIRDFVSSCSTADVSALARELESPLRQTFSALEASSSLDVVKIELQNLVYLCNGQQMQFEGSETASDVSQSSSGITVDPEKIRLASAALCTPSILRQILDFFTTTKFVTNWLPLLTSWDRETLLEPLFLQTSPVVALLALAQNLGTTIRNDTREEESDVISSKILAQEQLNRISNEQIVRVIVDLLDKFFNLQKLSSPVASSMSCFRSCIREVSKMETHRRTRTWNEILVLVGSLPDRIANLMRRQTPPHFAPVAFFDAISRESLVTLDEISAPDVDLSESPMSQIGLISQLFSKICVVGRATCVSNAVVSQLLRRFGVSGIEPEHNVWLDILRRTIQEFQVTAFEPFLDAFLLRIDGISCSDALIRELIAPLLGGSSTAATYLLTTKFPTTRLLPYNVVRGLVTAFQASFPTDKFLHILSTNTDVWGSPSFIKNSSFPVQNRLTAFIVAGLKLVDKQSLDNSTWLMKLIGGVHNRMENPLPAVRRLGMIVAEVFSKIVQPEEPIKFEYDPDPEDAQILGTVVPTANTAANATSAGRTQQTPPAKPAQKRSAPKRRNRDPDALFIPDDDGDDEEELSDERADVPQNSDADNFYAGIPKAKALADDVSDLKKVKRPNYLRECIALLRSDDPETLETALTAVEGLVRSRPDDLPEVSIQLSNTLLHLSNDYEIPDFSFLKQTAVSAIAALCHAAVFPWLCNQLFAENWGIAQRCEVIEIMVLAATELSGRTVVSEAPTADVKLVEPIQSSSSSSSLIKEAKTRRWGTGGPKAAKTTTNKFAVAASPMIQNLLDSFKRMRSQPSNSSTKSMFSDPILLAKFVWCLGELLQLVGVSSPDILKISKLLAQFLWSLRYSASSVVRRAVLLSVRALTVALPSALVETDAGLLNELNEIMMWVKEIASNDEDEECRKLSILCLMAFSTQLAPK